MADYTSEHAGSEIDHAVKNANLMLLTGAADPDTTTVGTLGQIYQNTTDGTLFRCTAIAGTDYTWTEWADYSLAEKAKVTGATAAALVLTGMTEAETYSALADTDTINTAFGKVKKFFTDIATTIRATVLTGLSVETATDVEATDTLLVGVGKLQGQTNAIDTKIGTQTYTEDNYVTDAESATASIDALDMAVKDNADLISNMSVVLSDLTFNATWKDGAAADAGTNVITLAGHGFEDNQPVEFGPGTGALPAGISAYNVDTKGGEYYYVISKTTDTFKISLTRGGTEVDITSAGTAGWQVRLGFIPILTSPVSLSAAEYKDIKIDVRGSIASGFTSFYPSYYLSLTSTDRQIFRAGSQWGNVIDVGFLLEPNTAISKYNFAHSVYDLEIVDAQAWIKKATMILSSADKSSGALLADTQQGAMINFGTITEIRIPSGQTSVSGFRSGARVIITGRKV